MGVPCCKIKKEDPQKQRKQTHRKSLYQHRVIKVKGSIDKDKGESQSISSCSDYHASRVDHYNKIKATGKIFGRQDPTQSIRGDCFLNTGTLFLEVDKNPELAYSSISIKFGDDGEAIQAIDIKSPENDLQSNLSLFSIVANLNNQIYSTKEPQPRFEN